MSQREWLRVDTNRDDGATAILAAILAVVLFGIGALAVELTDMFSRDRAVQTTADLAAFAGAQELPDACAAFDEALGTVNDPANGVRTDSGTTTFGVSATDMKDGDLTNGEIQVLGPTGAQIPLSSCPTANSTAGRKIRVTTPPRDVKFAFGSALMGASAGTVRAVAAVELRGLDVSVLPLSLPANCPSGPNYLYVDNGGVSGGPSAGTSPDYDPRGSNNNAPTISDVSPGTVSVPGPATVAVTVTDLKFDPTSAGHDVVFDWHLRVDAGTTLRSPMPSPVALDGTVVAGSVTNTGSVYSAEFDVPLTTTVQATYGSWKVRAMQTGNSVTGKWTDDPGVGTLVVGLPSVSSCPNPSAGDFGLLNSPRSDGGSVQQQRFRNFARGIDHGLISVATTTPNVACQSDFNPYPDGILDDNVPARGDESCIDVKPGESSSLPTDGLVDGRLGEPGRFVGAPGVSPGGDCRVGGDPDLTWTSRSGKTLIDTVLSCYLAPGKSLQDVADGEPDSLIADISQDPRFFFIPVTDTTIRPPNSAGGAQFWPITSFRGAFATNEEVGGDATCLSLDDCNGLLFNNGGTQLKAIQAFTFPLSALPTEVDQPGNGGDYYGGTKDFLLVE